MLIVAGFIFRRKGSLHRSLILSQGRTSYKVLCTVDFLFQNKQITMVIHNLNVWMRARYYKFCGHSHVTLLHNIVPSLVPRPIKIGLGMRLHCSMKTWQLYFLLSPHACEIGLAHETTLVSRLRNLFHNSKIIVLLAMTTSIMHSEYHIMHKVNSIHTEHRHKSK